MIYEVGDGQETLRIELREVGENLYDLTLEGRTVRVDAAQSGRTIYSIIEEGRQFEAMVDERGNHGFDVTVEGKLFHLEALDERSKILTAAVSHVASGPQTVLAEMPGKVVKLNAGVGDVVQAGQGILVIEAMKMENEIPSPIAGSVTSIRVAEGDTVESGATLFVVEPA